MKQTETYKRLHSYAEMLLKRLPTITDAGLPINATFDFSMMLRTRQTESLRPEYHFATAEYAVQNYPGNFLLLGVPGAGKSHAIKVHLIRWAYKCISFACEDFVTLSSIFPVPVYIDLKRYQGNLESQVAWVRQYLNLDELISYKQVHFLVDSFNEAPRKYLEDGSLRTELENWIAKTPDCRWIIVSRTSESLDFLSGPTATLTNMPERFVRHHLERLGFMPSGLRADSMIALLCKPIYFSALLSGRLKLSLLGTHPAQAIESMIQSHTEEIKLTMRFDPCLIDALGSIAESAIENGTEVFQKANVIQAIKSHLRCASPHQVAETIVERLIRSELLLAYNEQEIAFYHQSITELIASKQIARKLQIDVGYLDELLQSTRWNETLLLVTYFLAPDLTKPFFVRLLSKDPSLAGNITRFSEHHQSELTQLALEFALEESVVGWYAEFALSKLPVDTSHIGHIKQLLTLPGWKGGIGAILLARLLGDEAYQLIYDAFPIYDTKCDLTFWTKALSILMNQDRICDLMQLITQASVKEGGEHTRWHYIIRDACKNSCEEDVARAINSCTTRSDLLSESACEWAWLANSRESAEVLINELCNGSHFSVSGLQYRLERDGKWGGATQDVLRTQPQRNRELMLNSLDRLLKHTYCAEKAVTLGKELCDIHPAFREWFVSKLSDTSEVIRLAVITQIREYEDKVWQQVSQVFSQPSVTFTEWEFAILRLLEKLDWIGHEQLVLQIVSLRQPKLMLEYKCDLQLSWDWLEDYLPWFTSQIPDNYETGFLQYFPRWFLAHMDATALAAMMSAFNDPNYPFRSVIGEYFLEPLPNITPQAFTAESIHYMIESLETSRGYSFPYLLAKLSSEEMVETLLMPRLGSGSERFQSNLRTAIIAAGEKHRRRFL